MLLFISKIKRNAKSFFGDTTSSVSFGNTKRRSHRVHKGDAGDPYCPRSLVWTEYRLAEKSKQLVTGVQILAGAIIVKKLICILTY